MLGSCPSDGRPDHRLVDLVGGGSRCSHRQVEDGAGHETAQLGAAADDGIGPSRLRCLDDPFDHAHPDQVDEELAGQDLLYDWIAELLQPGRSGRVGLDGRGEGRCRAGDLPHRPRPRPQG